MKLISRAVSDSELLPSDVIDFLQFCPLRDFGRKQFDC